MSANALATDFTNYACAKLERSAAQIARCAALLSPDEIWRRPNGNSNSIGNLILHLTGNVRQWIVSSVGGEAFARNRPAEFAQREALPTEPMLEKFEETVRRACEVIAGLSEGDLMRRVEIQGYAVSVLTAVFHVVEHFSLHTGQIVYQTKAIKDIDLSLYDQRGRLLEDKYEHLP